MEPGNEAGEWSLGMGLGSGAWEWAWGLEPGNEDIYVPSGAYERGGGVHGLLVSCTSNTVTKM